MNNVRKNNAYSICIFNLSYNFLVHDNYGCLKIYSSHYSFWTTLLDELDYSQKSAMYV